MELDIINQLIVLLVSIFGDSVGEWITNALGIITVVIGSASLIVAALEKIAGITPNTKDDYYVGKAKRFLGRVTVIIDKIALNPNKDKARK